MTIVWLDILASVKRFTRDEYMVSHVPAAARRSVLNVADR